MDELFVRLMVAWVMAGAATMFALLHMNEHAYTRAVFGGTVGAIVGVLLQAPSSR
jgi:hypothetical protein